LQNLSERLLVVVSNATDGVSAQIGNYGAKVVGSVTFPKMSADFAGTYICTAKNHLGKVSKAFIITFPGKGSIRQMYRILFS